MARNHIQHGFQLQLLHLESRDLPSGSLSIDLVDGELLVQGDDQSNSFEVNLASRQLNELVRGTDSTTISYSDRLNRLSDLPPFSSVKFLLGGGDDRVVVNAANAAIPGNTSIFLGRGDDELTWIGNDATRLNGSFKVYGGTGKDTINLASFTVGSDLQYTDGTGDDTVVMHGVNVEGETNISFGVHDDTLLIADGHFAQPIRIRASYGDDTIAIAGAKIDRQLDLSGLHGSDTIIRDAAESSTYETTLRHVEQSLSISDGTSITAPPIKQLSHWLMLNAPAIQSNTANAVHDALRTLASRFEVSVVELNLNTATQTVTVDDPTPSISVLWDRVVQQAVIQSSPGPTIASRAYAMMHTAMFDAWSAYDGPAFSTQLGDTLQRPMGENTDVNKRAAMSFAAHQVLIDLFPTQKVHFDNTMSELGYAAVTLPLSLYLPASIGKRMANELLAVRHEDGSNQLGDDPAGTLGVPYSDIVGYQPVNSPVNTVALDRWTPEHVPIDATPQNVIRTQKFLTPQWGNVTPFALTSGDELRPASPTPFLLVDGMLDMSNRTITLADGQVLNIDRSLIGTVINPAFIQDAEEVIAFSANLTDKEKLIAEFWEDGGGSSFPPGTFMTFGQFVSARDNQTIDQDAVMFFALANSVFDAGIATWEAKLFYDYARPVRAIRDLGELGLIGTYNNTLGGYAIEGWIPGQGTGTILATDFLTYQTPGSDPSPPFPEHTSGHSAFSAAGSEILRRFTRSDLFGGSVTFPAGSSRFEPGTTPNQALTLKWETFSDAADEGGISRLYGGIHFHNGDLQGRLLGRQAGDAVWDKVLVYVNQPLEV